MINQLRLMLFRLMILLIQFKKLTATQKLTKLKKNNHDKYITTPEFKNLTAEVLLQNYNKENQQLKMILLISIKNWF